MQQRRAGDQPCSPPAAGDVVHHQLRSPLPVGGAGQARGWLGGRHPEARWTLWAGGHPDVVLRRSQVPHRCGLFLALLLCRIVCLGGKRDMGSCFLSVVHVACLLTVSVRVFFWVSPPFLSVPDFCCFFISRRGVEPRRHVGGCLLAARAGGVRLWCLHPGAAFFCGLFRHRAARAGGRVSLFVCFFQFFLCFSWAHTGLLLL